MSLQQLYCFSWVASCSRACPSGQELLQQLEPDISVCCSSLVPAKLKPRGALYKAATPIWQSSGSALASLGAAVLSLLSGHIGSTSGVFVPLLCKEKGLTAILSFWGCKLRRRGKKKREKRARNLIFHWLLEHYIRALLRGLQDTQPNWACCWESLGKNGLAAALIGQFWQDVDTQEASQAVSETALLMVHN